MEKTLAILKPDAVQKKLAGKIISRIYEKGFNIVELKMLCLDEKRAKEFYKIHAERPFFNGLIKYITSGPVIAAVLEKESAIKDWRNLMGATNPAEAAAGTIRKDFGENIETNVVHGSDSTETASEEVPFFFPDLTS